MRTAEVCPTCATYTNALCVVYNGPVLETVNVVTPDSVETALIKINNFLSNFTGTGEIVKDTEFDINSENPLQNNTITAFRDLVLSVIAEAPSYSSPSSSLNVSNQIIEKGSNINQTVNITFNQNDAGTALGYSLEENGTEISTTQSTSFSKTNVTSPVTLVGIVSYDDGVIKQNNLGVDDDTGRILAGQVSSASRTFTPRLQVFFDDVSSIPTNSTELRAFNNSVWNNQNQVNLNTGTTNNTFVVAIPSADTTAASLTAQDTTNNVGYTYDFQTTITLDLVNGTESYRLYVLSLDNPYPSSANHQITL